MSNPSFSNLGLPNPGPFTTRVVGFLFILACLELLLDNAGVPTNRLNWASLGTGQFEIYQPLTHVFVQGRNPFSVIIGLVVLYFFLPAFRTQKDRRTLISGVAAGLTGAIALSGLADVLGLLRPGFAQGWGYLITSLVVLFALPRPNTRIMLMFVIPVKAIYLMWGSLALAVLNSLASPTLGSWTILGAWIGTYGYWHTLGPGGRRRLLKKKADTIRDQLNRFTVIDGGRDDDDIYH